MEVGEWVQQERQIWHERFIPSLIAGIAVAIITLFFKLTASNIVLFSSLGASAAILSHKYLNRMTILRTIIISYFIALIISVIIIIISHTYNLPFSMTVLIAVTATTLTLYLFNVFHPPAVGASLSFIMLDSSPGETILIFFSVIVLLILVKLLTYAFYYEQLEMDKFMEEFKKLEASQKKKLGKYLS